MKKLGVLITMMIFAVAVMAQESAAELKNAGNAALREKNYKEAIAKYEAYFATGEEGVADDRATLYNLANSYYKIENFDKAIELFNKSVDNNYKGDLALYYISQVYKKQENEDMEIETLKRVLNEYPRSKYFKKFQDYITTKYNKDAQIPYNKANTIAMEAAGSGDAGVYLSKMKDVIALWEEAKTAFQKTLEVDPDNSVAKGAIANMEDQKKAYETYKASLNN